MDNTKTAVEEPIQNSILFRGLIPDLCDKILDSGFRQQFDHKSILFHQGDPDNVLYMVINGRLKISKLNDQGEEDIIRYINIGELAAVVAILFAEKD